MALRVLKDILVRHPCQEYFKELADMDGI